MKKAVALVLLQILQIVHGQQTLSAQELYDGIQQGIFQAVVDVRTATEWNRGHIENATLLESLNAYNTSSQVATPEDIAGCRNCSIAVYCQSGRRAGIAIGILRENGFTGPLYNGLGTSQWTTAGFPLVQTDSVEPECQVQGECCPCKLEHPPPESMVPTRSPVLAPTSAPVDPPMAPVGPTRAPVTPAPVSPVVPTPVPVEASPAPVVLSESPTDPTPAPMEAMPSEEPTTSDAALVWNVGGAYLSLLVWAIVLVWSY